MSFLLTKGFVNIHTQKSCFVDTRGVFVDCRHFVQASNYAWSGNEGVLGLVDVVKSVIHSGVEIRGSKSALSPTTLSTNQRFINKGPPLSFQSILLKKNKGGSVCSIE